MAPILIFRHVPCEGPGYLGQFLDQRGVAYRVVKIDRGESMPSSIDGVGGLVFLGGPMSVNDSLPWMNTSLALIRAAYQRCIAVLGHCLGGQLIAAALGATVRTNPVKEIGWLPVRSCRGVHISRLPHKFEAFHWHGEAFSLPPGATHLFESEACRHQGFQIGNLLALQFHLEIQPAMVGTWAEYYAKELDDTSDTVQSHLQMTSDLETRIPALHRIADTIYDHWLARSPLG